jgi:hypothetical protein
MNDFEARRDEAVRVLLQKGLARSSVEPPLLRLLWRLGMQVRPPPFASFASTALGAGTFFAVGWGGGMWAVLWRFSFMSGWVMAAAAGLAGVLFGLSIAGLLAWRRRTLALPTWEQLLPSTVEPRP